MLAEEKAQNDPSQYFTNRAKMLKEKSNSSQSSTNNATNIPTKADKVARRLAAMAKISETFGYGEKLKNNAKKESPPLKKPLIPTEPKPKKKIQTANKPKDVSEPRKPTRSNSTPGVKKWDFGSKPRNESNGSKLDVDPELDGMLAQLENDEDFMKLSDNEQITWLESLFFLDTPSKAASSGLVKPKPRQFDQQPSR